MFPYIVVAIALILLFMGTLQAIKKRQGKPIKQFCQHCHKITSCYYRGHTALSKDGTEYAPRTLFDWRFRRYSKWECTECGQISYFRTWR